jgi:hypothetical protein
MTGTITNPRVRRSGVAQSSWFGPGDVPKLLKQRQKWPSAASLAQRRNLRILHWKTSRKPLRFVQRGRILLRCGSAFALSLPSLGVSSLDLGRLFTQAALFSWLVIPGRAKREPQMCDCTSGESRDSGFSPPGCPGMTKRVELPTRNYSAAAWNGPRSPSGTAASASARLAKSATTWANRGPRSRRRSSM